MHPDAPIGRFILKLSIVARCHKSQVALGEPNRSGGPTGRPGYKNHDSTNEDAMGANLGPLHTRAKCRDRVIARAI